MCEGGDDAGLVDRGVGHELVEFGDPFADGGDVDRRGGGRRQVGGVVVEPFACGETAVLVFGPSPAQLRIVGLGSVAGGGGVEVSGVAPGGELADLVVPDLRAGGVGGPCPVPVGEPAGGLGGEGEGESLAAHGDRCGQEVWFVGVDAVGLEGGGPVGEVFVDGGLGELEVGVGFGGGVGWFGVVDGSDVGPFHDLAGASSPSVETNSTTAVPVVSMTAMTVPMLSQSAALTCVPEVRNWRWARARARRSAALVGSV